MLYTSLINTVSDIIAVLGIKTAADLLKLVLTNTHCGQQATYARNPLILTGRFQHLRKQMDICHVEFYHNSILFGLNTEWKVHILYDNRTGS